MPESDLALLIRAARAAAEVALGYSGDLLNVRHKAADGSPVTDADIAVNDTLQRILMDARPDYGWLSEESANDPARQDARRVFIVDPIDGTRSFIGGGDVWAHALAVADEGRVTAAVVLMPQLDRLFSAETGGGAHLNGESLTVRAAQTLEDAHVLATKPALAPERWQAPAPAPKRSYRPAMAYQLALVAQGRFDAVFSFRRAWEWDIAAGALLLAEAGAVMTDIQGRSIRFNAAEPRHDGLVAASPALHGDILGRLART